METCLISLKCEAVAFCRNLTANAEHLPRDDYKELLELNFIFLGENPPRGVHFHTPGAVHRSRKVDEQVVVCTQA